MDTKQHNLWFFQASLLFVLGFFIALPATANAAVVQAVLFYSPTCPHCQHVIDEVLTPLAKKYQDQLVIVSVNVRDADGQQLYRNAIASFSIADERRGVPTLIVGEQVMVGAVEIPQRFPALVATLSAQNGIALPNIPGLDQALSDMPAGMRHEPSSVEPLDPLQKLALDPLGNGLAVAVLLMLVLLLLHSLRRFPAYVREAAAISAVPPWPVAVTALLGLAIAAYMGYVETAEVSAVCGPVGDCNTVQQSDYAKLLGIPLGIIGIGGYLLILALWWVARRSGRRWAALATVALGALSFGGTLFSIYLTFLEPFVIGATCAWCLGSAVCMAVLLWLTRRPAAAAWRTLVSGVD